MSDTPIKVLLSNGVRNFLSGGGQIGLKGQEDATGRLYWIVVARSLDGATFHVLETRNGTPGALSPHLQRITTSPDIFPMPITSASRPSETAPALPGYERNTAYTAEVIPFPGANPDERPMNPGGGGGGVESGLRLRSYGNHICAVLLVSLIVSCKYWIPFVMAAGPALGPSLVALIVFVIATIRKDLPFGSAFFLNCSILLIVVAAFYLPLMVAPAILGSVIAIIGLALR